MSFDCGAHRSQLAVSLLEENGLVLLVGEDKVAQDVGDWTARVHRAAVDDEFMEKVGAVEDDHGIGQSGVEADEVAVLMAPLLGGG